MQKFENLDNARDGNVDELVSHRLIVRAVVGDVTKNQWGVCLHYSTCLSFLYSGMSYGVNHRMGLGICCKRWARRHRTTVTVRTPFLMHI
jgi:hypothetical protein